MMGFGLGMGLLGWLTMLVFWGGLILLTVWLVGLLFPVPRQNESRDSALSTPREILKTRYARGELTQEQYYQMLQTLEQE